MIKSYFNFINESIVKYSDSFREILTDIKDVDSVSDILLKMENNDHEVVSNYIDLGDDEETIKFSPDKKIQKSLSENPKIDPFTKNRQSIRIGRGIRSILASNKDINVSDADIEKFVNRFKSVLKKKREKYERFELVKGDVIEEWYNQKNYCRRSIKGTLWNSCMRYGYDYFGIYKNNPHAVSLLILKSKHNPEEIVGRALVWEANINKTKIKFMDRVYTIHEEDVDFFRNYAIDHGMYYKYNNNSTDYIELAGKNDKKGGVYLWVKLNSGISRYDSFPYLDTLKYLDLNTGEISNRKDGDDIIVLDDTEGGYSSDCEECGGDRYVTCDNCGGDEYTTCYECDGDGVLNCDDCDGEGNIQKECESCDGNGENVSTGTICDDCDGEGNIQEECESCEGSGERYCNVCGGDGNLTCYECDGGNVECPACS